MILCLARGHQKQLYLGRGHQKNCSNGTKMSDEDTTVEDTTDKDTTDEDIEEYFFPKSKGKNIQRTKIPTPTVIFKSPIPIKGCVLGLANVQTWDNIVKKIEVRKPKSCADNAKGKIKAFACWEDVGANHFEIALQRHQLAKVTAIEEAKDLATLTLDELIGNLKVYKMVLDNDGVASNTTKKVKSLALKAKVTMEQTSDDSDSQGGSDEDVNEEEAEAFNLMARNFRKFFCKGNRFGRGNRFGNGANRFGRSRKNSFGNKGGESSRQKGVCYNCGIEGHFASECTKPKENKVFVRKAWSDSEDGDEPQNDATCLMAIDSQEVQPKPSISNNDLDIIDLQKENEKLLRFNKDFTKTFKKLLKEERSLESEKSKLLSKINDLEIEVKKLVNDKEVVEPYKKCEVLTKEVDSLKCNVSRLQDEALNFSKFKKSIIILDDMLSRQKLSQDKEGLGFSKIEKTTSISLNKPTVLPEPKSSPSAEDDRINEPIVQDPNGSLSLQVNVSDEGYIKSVKEAKYYPIEQVIVELNERTLRSKTKQA
ncbi:retrovirus-related pol polyprotein from transposon TNT 1-94 [Tanacetum coccineum]|uniref:Retrovirus-related pol polyprotein from transposon TNT 1-94 n=1 Tax=Tanacetum coccineum TaxID=301880 RepID=A0ABQ5H3Y9_9ASTR